MTTFYEGPPPAPTVKLRGDDKEHEVDLHLIAELDAYCKIYGIDAFDLMQAFICNLPDIPQSQPKFITIEADSSCPMQSAIATILGLKKSHENMGRSEEVRISYQTFFSYYIALVYYLKPKHDYVPLHTDYLQIGPQPEPKEEIA